MEVGTFKRPAPAIARVPKPPKWLEKLSNPDPRIVAAIALGAQIRSLRGFDPLAFANAELSALKAEAANLAMAYAIAKLNDKKSQGLIPEDMQTSIQDEYENAKEEVEEAKAMIDSAKALVADGLAVAEGYMSLL